MIGIDEARKLADAVLYEGYLLYPYRASSGKNRARVRWQFGVIVPRRHAGANPLPPGSQLSSTVSGAVETWWTRTECIAEPGGPATRLTARLRFLQMQSRVVEELRPEGFVPVEALEVDGQRLVTWDEGLEREVTVELPLDTLAATEHVERIELPAAEGAELVTDREGRERGRIVRRTEALSLRLRLAADALPGPYGIVRPRAVVENVTDWTGSGAEREEVLTHCSISTHLILTLSDGAFISLREPPEWARPAVASCTNQHTWPVLVGEERADTVLSAPIVLDDFPRIAPESTVDLFDGTENDELLSLRIMTLTDEEKSEARATDPRAAAIIEGIDNLPPEVYERLHGAIRSLREVTGEVEPRRPAANAMPEIWTDELGELTEPPVPGAEPGVPWWNPGADASVSPETDGVPVRGVEVARGSRVRLCPQPGNSDAQDMFLAGRTAVVQAVYFDVDDEPYLAVTLEDDPGADLMVQHGRYLFFRPYEVEPLDAPSPEVTS